MAKAVYLQILKMDIILAFLNLLNKWRNYFCHGFCFWLAIKLNSVMKLKQKLKLKLKSKAKLATV